MNRYRDKEFQPEVLPLSKRDLLSAICCNGCFEGKSILSMRLRSTYTSICAECARSIRDQLTAALKNK